MIYSTSVRTAITTTLNSILEINTSATQSCRILEIGIMTSAATALSIVLARPTTGSAGMTYLTNGSGSANAGFQAEQDSSAPVAQTRITISAGTPAVIASGTASPAIRRAAMAALVGAGVVWTFPRGLYMPPNATGLNAVCLLNNGVGVACDVWVVIDE